MKLLRNVKYDINEGLLKYWYKWILLFVLQTVNCCIAYDGTFYVRDMYGERPLSAIEIGGWCGLGRFPYLFNSSTPDTFTLPFEWIIQYVVLAYIVGGYIKEDMQGYGIHLMIKRNNRGLWWLSKFIWCVILNVFYFGTIWFINIVFSWVVSGKEMLEMHYATMMNINDYFLELDKKEVFVVLILLPMMVGVVHSMIQMVVSLFYSDEVALALIGALLVLTSYYSHFLLPSGYSMSKRFDTSSLDSTFEPINYQFGLLYLGVCILVMYIAGLFYVKKKNIYW